MYIDNHDGMSGQFNYHTAQLYGQGILFMLAHPYGAAAQIMSSFYYPDGDSATKFSPPLVPMTLEEEQKSRTDYRVNLTRKVDAAFGRCRITPHDAVPYTEPDAAWLNGTCENGGTGCNWICQHRWTGVAGLTHVRKLIPKDVSMERIWIAAPGRFSFSIGDRAWVFLQQYLNPNGDLKVWQQENIAMSLNCHQRMQRAFRIGLEVMGRSTAVTPRTKWSSSWMKVDL